MRIIKKEVFGLVCVIIKFDDEDDALRQVNDTSCGSADAVFTKDITRGMQLNLRTSRMQVLRRPTARTRCTRTCHFRPFKQSGVGRE